MSGQRVDLDRILIALTADGLVEPLAARRIRSEAAGDGRVSLHPLVVIANQKINNAQQPEQILSLEILTRWLAREALLPYYHIDPMKIDVDSVTAVVSQGYARQHRILPVEVNLREAVVATSEPFLLTWLPDVRQILRREIRVVVANPLEINRFLLEFYGVTQSVARAKDANLRGQSDKILNFEQLLQLGETGKLTADDQHVIYIVDWLLQFAYEQRASDIHLEPRRERSNIRFRIDGYLHDVYQLPTPVMAAVTARIKILGRMDVAEKRRPQDGRLKTRTPAGREIELRLSTMPTAFGEKCVMRIFDPDVVTHSLSQLGFDEREASLWRNMVERPHGIVLVTGPTGSGKTTTLYSTLKHLARPDINVCTIEDPIEMVSPEFNQMQVHSAIGVDFAQGVRTLLRQDPDIIMVGEIRDLETAEMAIQASLTGHLVLSTLHTNDAPSAIVRLLDLGVPYYLLKGTVCGIVAQRLLRTLCVHCRVEGTLDPDAWRGLVEDWPVSTPATVKAPKGCTECRKTGYRGRTAIYEMLSVTDAVADAIQPDLNLAGITRLAYGQGLLPLRVAAARKVSEGLTTVIEAARVVPPSVVGARPSVAAK